MFNIYQKADGSFYHNFIQSHDKNKKDLFKGVIAKNTVKNTNQINTDYTFSEKKTLLDKILDIVTYIFCCCFGVEVKDSNAEHVFDQIKDDINEALTIVRSLHFRAIHGHAFQGIQDLKKKMADEMNSIRSEIDEAIVPVLKWIIDRKKKAQKSKDVEILEKKQNEILHTLWNEDHLNLERKA